MPTRCPRWLLTLAVILMTGHAKAAIPLDSCLNLPVMGVPVVNYTPETSWVFGAAMQGYFRCKEQTRTSIVQVDGAYSLAKQWYIHSSGTIYCGKHRPWIIRYSLGYRHYPDTYYEPGNEFLIKNGTAYTSQRLRMALQPMKVLPHDWAIGPNVHVLYDRNTITSPVAVVGMGVVAQYDTRDVLYYPHRGLHFKTAVSHYQSVLSDATTTGQYGILQADLRQFVPLYRDLILAWQFRTEWALGKQVPYQLLPTLGGADLLRGITGGMFRDNAMLALQTELRIPIWSIVHGTVFAGIGDVYNTTNWKWSTPKIGYGIGLRVGINRAKVNIRFDLARNNIYKEWNTWNSYSFYFTATEAF